MRRVAYLPKLQRRAERRLISLSLSLDPSLRFDPLELDRRVAFATIEAANIWNGFCRSFYLSCALGTHGSDGAKIVGRCRFHGEDQALAYAISLVSGPKRAKPLGQDPRDEPPWHQVGVFAKIMRSIDPPNLPKVQTALSVSTSAFSNLQLFRNFYAHRSKSSAQKTARAAPRLRVSSALHPTGILSSFPSGASDTILREWLADLVLIVDLMD